MLMSKSFRRLRLIASEHWAALTSAGALFLITITGLLFRLNTLLPGYSTSEATAYHAADSLKTIWDHPLNAPFEILVHGLRYLIPDNLIVVRLVSVLIGWLTLIVFTFVVFKWHGWRAAVMSSLLFGLSAWFLHVSRLGTPQSMFFGLFLLVGCGVWLREKKAGLAAFLGLALSAVLLYTPGMIWFLGIGLILQLPSIDRAFKKQAGAVVLGSAFFVAIMAPLVWHFYNFPTEIRAWLCLPTDWSNILHILRSIADVPQAIFFRAPVDNPEHWVGRLPVLSVFATVMALAGLYVYSRHIRLARVRIILLLVIFGAIVIGVSDGQIPITPLVPFIYLVAAAGLGYLIDIWYEVFPRNPLARALGMTVISLTLATACLYNVRSYFTAWPQANVTRILFTVKKP